MCVELCYNLPLLVSYQPDEEPGTNDVKNQKIICQLDSVFVTLH